MCDEGKEETVYYRHKYYSGKYDAWLWDCIETVDDFEPGTVAFVGTYHGKSIYENISDRYR